MTVKERFEHPRAAAAVAARPARVDEPPRRVGAVGVDLGPDGVVGQAATEAHDHRKIKYT
jgi:hypothetical protein